MSRYECVVRWERGDQPFTDRRYSRLHRWVFDEGVEVPASSSPHHVPLPLSSANAVDPEEAFVAALSSCHMLCFLAIAAGRGFRVDRYEDPAVGEMTRLSTKHLAITTVTLRPRVEFSGGALPNESDLQAMHHEAHEDCFIAHSVKTEVRCEPVMVRRAARGPTAVEHE